jgi:hypothetical protein
MRFRNSLTAVAVLICGSTWANPQSASPADAGRESAVWSPKELTFAYTGFTTKYTCDGLQAKMRSVLLELGSRPDLQVRGYGCTRLTGPDPFAGVTIKMNVLQRADKPGGQAVPAHWKMVDLLANRDPLQAAADCELIDQIREKVLPLFATRNVDYSAACAAHMPLVGGTRLKAEVLVPDESAAANAVAR